MKKTTWAPMALISLALLVGAVGVGCGSSSSSGSNAAAKGNPTDRAFVAEMVPHHQSAIDMARVAKTEATGVFVKKLAASISSTQKAEIAEMMKVDNRLADAGVKRGKLGMSMSAMGMDMKASDLEGAKPFDAKFIAMMTPHHRGAIAMAKEELAKGKNAELKTLAKSIITTQRREIAAMEAHASGSATGMDGMHSSHSE